MFFRRFFKRLYGCCIMGFVCGIFLAFVMPPIVIAIVEGVLLGFMCWCFYWGSGL